MLFQSCVGVVYGIASNRTFAFDLAHQTRRKTNEKSERAARYIVTSRLLLLAPATPDAR